MDDDDVLAFGSVLLIFFAGFTIGTIPPEKGQATLNHFEKAPVCVEQKVGLDTIEKCYKLVEVK